MFLMKKSLKFLLLPTILLSSCQLWNRLTAKQSDYVINCSEELPVTKEYGFSYSDRKEVYTRCLITDIKYEIQEKTLCIFLYGKKTYDKDGEYGTNFVEFQIVLKDQDGMVVGHRTVGGLNLIVGQSFGDEGYLGYQFVKESALSKQKTYTLLINDYYL